MIRAISLKEKKRKVQEVTEEWMNTPITFPLVSTEDVSDETLIVEAEVEGYLFRRIYVDGGASTDLVGFVGEATKPLGKIELEVCFGSERRLEKKQMVEEGEKKEEIETRAVNITEEVLVNLAFPNQLVVIGGGLPETCKSQLKLLLKNNMDIFA
ncbi:hypothetical protein Tco_0649849 [Tanacetum coccineum]